MSEQKEMKNAAEAQVPEQNTTETAAKQNEDAKQADTTEQQADAAAFQVVNEGFSTREAIEEAKRCPCFPYQDLLPEHPVLPVSAHTS